MITKKLTKLDILKFLPSFLDGEILLYDEVDSTNVIAKNLANNGSKDNTVVIANSQTNGRGRMGRKFFSPSNSGLYMSMVIRAKSNQSNQNLQQSNITIAAAVAVVRAIKSNFGINAGIKWVNDIYVDGRKACGILAESKLDCDNNIDYMVLGIGVNLDTCQNEFPQELQSLAGSILPYSTIKDWDINRLVANIVSNIISIIQSSNVDIINEYKASSIVVGKVIDVCEGMNQYTATAVDIDTNGGLIVRRHTSNIQDCNLTHVLTFGEISIKGDWRQ